MSTDEAYREVLQICAKLCALGIVRCTGVDEDGDPKYEATALGRKIIKRDAA